MPPAAPGPQGSTHARCRPRSGPVAEARAGSAVLNARRPQCTGFARCWESHTPVDMRLRRYTRKLGRLRRRAGGRGRLHGPARCFVRRPARGWPRTPARAELAGTWCENTGQGGSVERLPSHGKSGAQAQASAGGGGGSCREMANATHSSWPHMAAKWLGACPCSSVAARASEPPPTSSACRAARHSAWPPRAARCAGAWPWASGANRVAACLCVGGGRRG